MFVCFVIHLLLYKVGGAPTEFVDKNGLQIKEVPFGETVLLQCMSNDGQYNFEFWLFNNRKVVIGPSNKDYDGRKYRYEILSGNLTIRALTLHDQGLYSCISKEVHGNEIKVDHVDLIVFDNSSKINTIRILIVLIVLVILGAGGYFLYTIWRDRFRYPRYLEQSEDEEDEESEQELFTGPSTSGISNAGVRAQEHESFDNISTDFKSILDTANEE